MLNIAVNISRDHRLSAKNRPICLQPVFNLLQPSSTRLQPSSAVFNLHFNLLQPSSSVVLVTAVLVTLFSVVLGHDPSGPGSSSLRSVVIWGSTVGV